MVRGTGVLESFPLIQASYTIFDPGVTTPNEPVIQGKLHFEQISQYSILHSTPSSASKSLVGRLRRRIAASPSPQNGSRCSNAQHHRLPYRLTITNATTRHTIAASEALTLACQSHVRMADGNQSWDTHCVTGK
jgi:hypothetical protein